MRLGPRRCCPVAVAVASAAVPMLPLLLLSTLKEYVPVLHELKAKSGALVLLQPLRGRRHELAGRVGLLPEGGGKREQGKVPDVGDCHSFASSSARGGALFLLRPLRGRRRELREAGGGLGSARKRHLSGSSVECERGARRRVS